MTNLGLCLFTLSLITLTFALQTIHVMSDEAMIINICNKTANPNLCQTCLHSDPKSITADIKGLAMISITCGFHDAYNLYVDTHDLSESTTTPALPYLLSNCSGRFQGTAETIDSTRRVLGEKGADAAKRVITDYAMWAMTQCTDLIKKSPRMPVPKYIVDGMKVVNTDMQIILEILNNIIVRQ